VREAVEVGRGLDRLGAGGQEEQHLAAAFQHEAHHVGAAAIHVRGGAPAREHDAPAVGLEPDEEGGVLGRVLLGAVAVGDLARALVDGDAVVHALDDGPGVEVEAHVHGVAADGVGHRGDGDVGAHRVGHAELRGVVLGVVAEEVHPLGPA
ncbi:MAG: hypothetical protein ACK559_38305, partial [bacterium]